MTNEQSAKEHLALVRPTVMVVDDTPQNLALMTELLRDDYRVVVANSGERALKLLQAGGNPDLILLDIMMPGMDGYEVITRLKADEKTRDIPVMFLTAKSEVEDETHGLELGAVDYIIKPISPPIVMARVRTHLALKASADFLRDKAQYLESEVAKRTRQVEAIQDVTVLAMSSMAETRDNETGNHILRTQRYIKRLAEQLRDHPNFRQELTDDYIKQLFKSAPLHDIGKVGITSSSSQANSRRKSLKS
jgi:putative two-component system response regulator